MHILTIVPLYLLFLPDKVFYTLCLAITHHFSYCYFGGDSYTDFCLVSNITKTHGTETHSMGLSSNLRPQAWTTQYFSLLKKFSPKDMLINFREREEGRERNREKHQCEREALMGCLLYVPLLGLNLQPRNVPWPGTEPAAFWWMGQCSNQMSYLARAILVFLKLFPRQGGKRQIFICKD